VIPFVIDTPGPVLKRIMAKVHDTRIGYPSRSDAGRVYNIQHWAELKAGGHFAALEEPEAFADDVGSFFSNCR
jgi:pimeloyl-ACP methyl ester carboxylesterase